MNMITIKGHSTGTTINQITTANTREKEVFQNTWCMCFIPQILHVQKAIMASG